MFFSYVLCSICIRRSFETKLNSHTLTAILYFRIWRFLSCAISRYVFSLCTTDTVHFRFSVFMLNGYCDFIPSNLLYLLNIVYYIMFLLSYIEPVIQYTLYIFVHLTRMVTALTLKKKTFPFKRYGTWHFWNTFTVLKNMLYFYLNTDWFRNIYIY